MNLTLHFKTELNVIRESHIIISSSNRIFHQTSCSLDPLWIITHGVE